MADDSHKVGQTRAGAFAEINVVVQLNKAVQSQRDGDGAANQPPGAESLVMRGHVGGCQRQSVTDEQGNQSMGRSEENAIQLGGRFVNAGVEQDQQEEAEATINGNDADHPGSLAPMHLEE